MAGGITSEAQPMLQCRGEERTHRVLAQVTPQLASRRQSGLVWQRRKQPHRRAQVTTANAIGYQIGAEAEQLIATLTVEHPAHAVVSRALEEGALEQVPRPGAWNAPIALIRHDQANVADGLYVE
jgi:hypothetical protein